MERREFLRTGMGIAAVTAGGLSRQGRVRAAAGGAGTRWRALEVVPRAEDTNPDRPSPRRPPLPPPPATGLPKGPRAALYGHPI